MDAISKLNNKKYQTEYMHILHNNNNFSSSIILFYIYSNVTNEIQIGTFLQEEKQ